MNKKKIFVTGATGCIGHYVLDELLTQSNIDIHLLVRDPQKFQASYQHHEAISFHRGDLEHIEAHQRILSETNVLIHIATAWGDSDYSINLNRDKTHEMFSFLDSGMLEKIVYFSTASILGPGNRPVREALTEGTGYIRSKYLAYMSLPESKFVHKIVTVFPTMVFGGDASHPYSHISSGIVPSLPYLNYVRFINMHGAFHFLHARDIASVTVYLALNPTTEQNYVLGNEVISGKQAVKDLCEVFGVRSYFQIKITSKMLMILAKLFKIKVAPWDKYCIEHPFFEYRTVHPGTFGLKRAFPTLKTALEDVKARNCPPIVKSGLKN